MSDSDELVEIPEEEADDLFGDEDDEVASDRGRDQSDAELASDRDGDEGYGREGDTSNYRETRDKVIESVEMYRHRIPKPKDGNLQSLRVPRFLKFIPELYNPVTFRPSESDIANAKEATPKHTVRLRKDPNTGESQSNTMIHRWSDGSMTMSVGDEHYEIQKKALAPPMDKPYQELQDGHYYAASAQLASNTLMVVGHVAEQYTVRPGKAVEDDALARLAERMAAASRNAHEGDMFIKTKKDPELQKKEAEQAEKDRMKAQRRRETAAARMDVGQGRYGRSGGLSIGDLEGGRRAGGSRKRGPPGAPKQKRRKPEYDSDDDLPSGARRGDDYDIEDDFIAPSDEDVESGVEDDDEELLDDDDEDDDRPRTKRQKTAEAEDVDADAEADLEDDVPAQTEAAGRGRRRHIIDDDDE